MNRFKSRRRHRLLPSQRAEAVRLVLEDGVPVNAVARQFRTSWGTVDYWIKKTINAAEPAINQQQGAEQRIPTSPAPDQAPVQDDAASLIEGSSSAPIACGIDQAELLAAQLNELRAERDFLRSLVLYFIGLRNIPAGSLNFNA